MTWEFTLYSLPPFVATAISAVVALVAWRHRERPIARPFVALVVAVAAWSLAYAVQLGFDDLESQLLWWRVGITIGGAIPTIWLALAVEYADVSDRLTPRRIALLAVDPVLFSLLVWTDPAHGLIVREATLAGSPPVAQLSFGAGYLIHIAYAYLLVVVGILLILRVFVRSSRIYRRQAGLMVVGAVVPLSANVAFTLGVGPVPELDLTTFAFTVTGSVFAVALFRFELLDLVPIAHESMIDELGDGVLVLDAERRIVDYNANAERVLDADLSTGRSIDGLLPGETLREADGRVIEARIGGTRRFYQVRLEPLLDFQDRLAGRVVALRDVTDREAYEQRLRVANRLLRHNLRNDMNVLMGHAELLRSELSGEPAASARKIEETAAHIAELSEKAKGLERTLDAERSEQVAVDAVEVVANALGRLRDRHPEVGVETSLPGEARASVVGEDLLEVAVLELVENAIKHGDGTPRVSVAAADGTVRIAVADDGPGVPTVEREVLSRGTETDLRHGSGVGLWLVHWIAAASGGEVAFEDDAEGSAVTIRLPRAPP